jgi:GT2 family glycosyltransferase
VTGGDADRRPVAVVMLTWNALAVTKECLQALQGTTDHPAWRLIVVDNGSTDGTVEWLRGVPDVHLVENGQNLGFSAGCNVGLAACQAGEDVVLMNNDTVVLEPGWLAALQDAAYDDPRNGVVGARLIGSDGRIGHLGSYMPPSTLTGQQMGGLETDVNQCRRQREVESVVFALAYLRRDCMERVGTLDEDFFAYFEDSDYCIRAQRAGFRVVYAGGVDAIHHNNVSTRQNGVDFWSMFDRSGRVFRRKWATWLEEERYEAELVWHSILHRAPGYALQSRKLMAAMHFAGLRVTYRNAYGDNEPPTEHPLLADLVRRRRRADVPQVGFCQADVFKGVKGRHRIGWTMLEVNGLPREWVDGCNLMDEVWVPASFNEDTFRASGVRVPIRVMPLGVDVDYYHPGITGFRPSSRFIFLSVFEWGERKGADLLLRAFAEEFKQSEDVLLLLSIYNRDPSVDVQAEVDKLDLPPSPPIVVMTNAEFAEYQMGALYRSADCFVLPTRGEGWGMPVLEAMACGLPTIATGWSGPADFLHDGVGYPLQVRSLVPAKARCPYYDGFEWAEPDFEHLRFLMREVFDRPDRARQKGRAAAAEVASRYSLEHTAERVKRRLLELS